MLCQRVVLWYDVVKTGQPCADARLTLELHLTIIVSWMGHCSDVTPPIPWTKLQSRNRCKVRRGSGADVVVEKRDDKLREGHKCSPQQARSLEYLHGTTGVLKTPRKKPRSSPSTSPTRYNPPLGPSKRGQLDALQTCVSRRWSSCCGQEPHQNFRGLRDPPRDRVLLKTYPHCPHILGTTSH